MSTSRYPRLEDVVQDALFPDVDLALRRGRHVTADELAYYTFLSDAREHLDALYRRYGCELMHKADGFFYLLPTGDKLGKRHLRPIEMLVGQALALLYLDPRTVEAGGTIVRDDVLGQLASVLGEEDLVRALYPGKKRIDERVAQEGVRAKVADAIRKLGTLGFVSTTDEGRIKLSPALLRFAEPARLGEPPDVVLARLAAEGELVITHGLDDEGSDDDAGESDSDDDDADDTTSSAPPPGDDAPPSEAAAEASPLPESPANLASTEADDDDAPPFEAAADIPLGSSDDDAPPFEAAADIPLDGSTDDDAPYVPAGPALDDEPYELEGPFGNEAADDEHPYELDATDAPPPTPEAEPGAPRDPEAPPSSRG